jgi:hypothetical protein
VKAKKILCGKKRIGEGSKDKGLKTMKDEKDAG